MCDQYYYREDDFEICPKPHPDGKGMRLSRLYYDDRDFFVDRVLGMEITQEEIESAYDRDILPLSILETIPAELKPKTHVYYADRVVDVKDGLPKFKAGSSSEAISE
jgi:hypothetical protein